MDDVQGSTGNQEYDMEGRGQFVEDCLGRLVDAYESACREGVSNPIVFLIDCEDAVGATIARAWEGDDAVDSAILANAGDGRDEEEKIATVLTRAFAFKESRQEVSSLFPYLTISFEQTPPEGHFMAVVVAYGGGATFFIPFS